MIAIGGDAPVVVHGEIVSDNGRWWAAIHLAYLDHAETWHTLKAYRWRATANFKLAAMMRKCRSW